MLSVAVDAKRSFAFRREIHGESPGLVIGCHLRSDSDSYLMFSWLQLDFVGFVALCLSKDQEVIFRFGVQYLSVDKLVIQPDRSACLGERISISKCSSASDGRGRAGLSTGWFSTRPSGGGGSLL